MSAIIYPCWGFSLCYWIQLIIDITVRHEQDHSKTFSLLVINLLNETAISALRASAGAVYSLATWAAQSISPRLLMQLKEHLNSYP